MLLQPEAGDGEPETGGRNNQGGPPTGRLYRFAQQPPECGHREPFALQVQRGPSITACEPDDATTQQMSADQQGHAEIEQPEFARGMALHLAEKKPDQPGDERG